MILTVNGKASVGVQDVESYQEMLNTIAQACPRAAVMLFGPDPGAGIVAIVAGIMWGAKLGVQFSIALVALKALPVLILGGFTSIPGAIVGGLIIGGGEKLAEVFLGPWIGGGIENWFAYMLAMVFLLFRPQGLFGERIIERI